MTELIVDFRNFANAPNIAENIAQAVTSSLTWEFRDYHLEPNCSWFSSVTPGGIVF